MGFQNPYRNALPALVAICIICFVVGFTIGALLVWLFQ